MRAQGWTAAPRRWTGARFLAAAVVGLLALQVVFLGLLVAAQAVPNRPIIAHLARAVATGDYGADYAPDGFGGHADRFTECVELGYGVSSPGDPRSLWYRATGGPRLDSCEAGKGEITRLAAGQRFDPPAGYFRYWNGYSIITRPVLATLGVTGVRLVSAALLALSAAAAFTALRRRLGVGAALAVLVPLAGATNAVAMPSSAFSHAIALAAVGGGVATTAVLASRGWRGAVVGAGLAAAVFDFMDLLTTPAMSWSLCAAVAGAVVHARGGRLRQTIAAVVAAGAAWPVAFGVTWVSRWVIAALVQGPGVFARVHDVASFRVDGDNAMVEHNFGAPTLANLRMWHATTVTALPMVVAGTVVVVVALAVALVRHGRVALAVAAVLAAPALIVPAWYEALSNHSQIHSFFTYTSLAAALGIVVMAAVVTATAAEVEPEVEPGLESEAGPGAESSEPMSQQHQLADPTIDLRPRPRRRRVVDAVVAPGSTPVPGPRAESPATEATTPR